MRRSRTGIDGHPVIQFEQVVKTFGSVIAVHETNLVVPEGAFFSLLGPSGCGKTTTLRMIAGFERPSRGRILLDGEDVSRVPPYRRNVNTVFQQYALFPHLTVFDNVAFGLRSRRTPASKVRRRVHEMLEVVRLPDLSARKPNQLSGGQQQRVALARALVNRPRALLLDEPLGALDLKLRETMQVELKRIQRDLGSTFVYVTHDQAEALTMSDHIAVMHDGRTEQVGTPEEIYHRPASAVVASFIGSANLVAATVNARHGERVVLEANALGTFDAMASGERFGPGQPAWLMVRPEAISVTAQRPPDAVASVPMVVTEVVFAGAVLRCSARSSRGAVLTAEIGPSGPLVPAVGAEVWLSWAEQRAVAVAADIGAEHARTPQPAAPSPGEWS